MIDRHAMPTESAIERTIREAIERGEFDDLEGKGKPLDLTAYFNTPEDMRMAYFMLKSNQFVPEEVELLREVARLKEEIAASTSDQEKTLLRRKLHDKDLALAIAMEKYKRKR